MKNLIFVTIILVFLNSCFAPINLTYESARTVNKGEIEIQGNYSRYYHPQINTNINRNFGVKAGYGLTDRYSENPFEGCRTCSVFLP